MKKKYLIPVALFYHLAHNCMHFYRQTFLSNVAIYFMLYLVERIL